MNPLVDFVVLVVYLEAADPHSRSSIACLDPVVHAVGFVVYLEAEYIRFR